PLPAAQPRWLLARRRERGRGPAGGPLGPQPAGDDGGGGDAPAGGLPVQRGTGGDLRLHLVGVLRLVRGDEQGPTEGRGGPAAGAARARGGAGRHPAPGPPFHALRGGVAVAGAV